MLARKCVIFYADMYTKRRMLHWQHSVTKTWIVPCALLVYLALARARWSKLNNDQLVTSAGPTFSYAAPNRWYDGDSLFARRDTTRERDKNAKSDLSLRELKADLTKKPIPARLRYFQVLSTWSDADIDVLDSFIMHHPAACMHVIFINAAAANSAAKSAIAERHKSGYCVSATHVRANDAVFSGELWSRKESPKWTARAVNPMHDCMQDLRHLIGYFLMSNYGGTYIGKPSLFLQPLPNLDEFVFLEDAVEIRNWTYNPRTRQNLSPGLIRLGKGSPIARDAFAFDSVVADANTCSGFANSALRFAVEQSTKVATKLPAILPSEYVHNLDASRIFPTPQSGSVYLQHMQRSYYLVQSSSSEALARWRTKAGGHVPLEHACTFTGQTLIVMRGTAARFQGPHTVRLAKCTQHAGKMNVLVHVRRGSLINACIGRGRKESTQTQSSGMSSAAEINAFLSCLVYQADRPTHDMPYDIVQFALSTRGGRVLARYEVELLVFQYAVSFMTHTRGRIREVNRLAKTIEQWYPGSSLYCTNDDRSVREYAMLPNLVWLPTEDDSGLSFNRNKMVRSIRSPFVQLLDDDFGVNGQSHLDLLLERVYLRDFDVASPIIPKDIDAGWKFFGLMTTSNGVLDMGSGDRGYRAGCLLVDYTPNVFLARRSVLLGIPWDPRLKLGEHEEFFLRVKQSQHVSIGVCEHANVDHMKTIWKPKHPDDVSVYVENRKREKYFGCLALKAHNLTTLTLQGKRMRHYSIDLPC